jgi:hypothetical protein
LFASFFADRRRGGTLGRFSRLELVASSVLTQIYEVSTPEEARLISQVGVDHIGILVGNGEFPREQLVDSAAAVAAAVLSPSKVSALFLTADLATIEKYARELRPAIVHPGAAPELLSPGDAASLKSKVPDTAADRPIVGHAKRADLPIGRSMTVEQQEIGDPFVAARDCNAFFVHDRHASHEERDPRGSTYRCRLEDEDGSNRLAPEGHQPRERILRSGPGYELVTWVRLHDDYATSAGIPQRSSGRLTFHDGNAEDRAGLPAQRGERHVRRS